MKLQSKAKMIGEYGCLAMCYIYCSGIKEDFAHYMDLISKTMDMRILDSDCTVLSAQRFIKYVSGRNAQITKKAISTIEDIKEKTPVRFSRNGFSHWVVVENGQIVFDSLDSSKCVKYGTVDSARIIDFLD
jgi:hypothetical protein